MDGTQQTANAPATLWNGLTGGAWVAWEDEEACGGRCCASTREFVWFDFTQGR